jgi:hypothetical protein
VKTAPIQCIQNEEFVMVCGFIDTPPIGLADGRILFKLRQNIASINGVLSVEQVQDFSSMWAQTWDAIPENIRKPVPAFFSYCFATFDSRSAEKVIHIQPKSFNMYVGLYFISCILICIYLIHDDHVTLIKILQVR